MAENFTLDPKDVQDNKIMAVLAYLGILFLVPLLAAKESPFARFHTNQGILLIIVGIVTGIALSILMAVLALISPYLLIVTTILYIVFYLGYLALIILGIVNAVKGEAKELPVIGKYRIIK